MRTLQQALSRVGRYTDPCQRFVATVLGTDTPIVADSATRLAAIANRVIQRARLANNFPVPKSTKAGKAGAQQGTRQGTIPFANAFSSSEAADNNNSILL